MQISRCLLVLCAAFCALSVRGDNEAQRKAREALERYVQSAPSQPATPTPAPAAPAAPAPKKSAPAPSTPPPATPLTAVPAADSDAIAKAREALRQKMQSLGFGEGAVPTTAQPAAPAQTAAPATPAAPVATPAPAVAPAPALVAQPTATTLAPIPAGADAATIAKAREAMRQKMQEVIAQEPAAVPQPPAAPVQAAAPPAAPAATTTTPAATPPPVAVAPAPAAPGQDPTEKARQALRQKMQELGAAPAAPAPTAPAIAQPTAPAPGEPVPVFPPGADEKSIAKARDAMRTKMQDVAAQPLPDTDQAIAEAKAREKAAQTEAEERAQTRKTRVTGFSKNLNFPALEGPPLPISPEKQQQLAELLRRYKADQISPEEYHAERAKILSGQ